MYVPPGTYGLRRHQMRLKTRNKGWPITRLQKVQHWLNGNRISARQGRALLVRGPSEQVVL